MRTRDQGPSRRVGQLPRPGTVKPPSPPAPARPRRSLARPGRARCPIFPENTPPFGPGSARRGKPRVRALGAARRRDCRCEARTAAMPVPVNPPSRCGPLPGLGRGRPARSGTAPRPPPRTPCSRAGSLPPAPRPAPYPVSRSGGGPAAAAAAAAAKAAAAGRAPGRSAAEGSAAEPRGAAPTMAELAAPSPPPPAP